MIETGSTYKAVFCLSCGLVLDNYGRCRNNDCVKLMALQGPDQTWKGDPSKMTYDPVGEGIPEYAHERQLKWDIRFMKLAKLWANENSKDPSTKCGAVLVYNVNKVISMGYNGFPAGVRDFASRLEDRDVKYQITLHCEENAIWLAEGRPLIGATIYTWPFQSCAHCAALLAQYGVGRAVSIEPSADILSRWRDSINLSNHVMHEAGISLKLLTQELVGVDNWSHICDNTPPAPLSKKQEPEEGTK